MLIDDAPWRVYLDVDGARALDADGDGEPDRFIHPHIADQAAKAHLRARGGGEAFTGLAGVAVFRHTVRGRWVVIQEGRPGPLPDLDPPVAPAGGLAIYIDADTPGVDDSVGDDAADGLTPNSAVATWPRAKAVAFAIIKRGGMPKFLLNRGDEFGVFGATLCKPTPDTPDWKGELLRGRRDQPVVFDAYGTGPNPVIVCEGARGFGVHTDSGHIAWRNIDARGNGPFISAQSRVGGLMLEGCRLEGASIGVVPVSNRTPVRMYGFTMIRCVVKGRVLPNNSRHKNGVFLDRVDDAVFIGNVICDWGWKENGSGSALSQGIYMTGECGPAKLARENVLIRNAGAGAQFRAGGVVHDNFAAWNGARGINVGQTLGAKTREKGGTCDVRGNVCFQRASPDIPGGAAMALGNLSSGLVEGNTLVNFGANQSVILDAAHGANKHGGIRVGLNRLRMTGNIIQGGLRIEHDGWGIEDPGPDNRVVVDNTNTISEGVRKRPTFADPDGKLSIDAATDAKLNIREPMLTDELRASILSGQTTAADLRARYGARR